MRDTFAMISRKVAAAGSKLSHQISRRCVLPLLQSLQPQAILEVAGMHGNRRLIALTIDDSPSAGTHRILDMLKDHDATATFFIHGAGIRSRTGERLIHRMLEEGHEVGNHMPESVPSLQLSPEEFATGFERNHHLLLEAGATPIRFRPSHGFYNRSMAEFMCGRGIELGYKKEFYLGLNFPWDVFFEIPEWYALHNAQSAVPGRIVVFHDNQDRRGRHGIINQSRRTLAALPVFFTALEKQGFKARSLANLEGLPE